MHRTKVRIVEDALDANNTIASANRADFDRAGVTVVNFMSAPGAGKTTLLERVVARPARRARRRARGRRRRARWTPTASPACTSRSRSSTPTPGFGGECHLDANMVRSAIPALPLDEIDLLVIENVGNLVCPAEFRIGEDARVMVCAVTEGEDKPLKYPLMFRACELVIVNKIDLLPHLDFDLDKLLYNIDRSTPTSSGSLLSARTGEGIDAWRDWLLRIAAARGGRCVSQRARAIRPTRLQALLDERTRARTRGSSRREAERLARLCHLMAERFARGGRLIAFGRSPAARSDARHVAVEFVHPVIVGKRALPAIGLAGEGGDARRAGRADRRARTTSRSRFGADDDGGEAARALALARARGCLTIAFAPAGAEWEFEPPTRRPVRPPGAGRDALPRAVGARARVLRASRPARGPRASAASHDAGASSFLYPFLDEREQRPRRRCSTTCAASVLMKAAGDRRAARADARPTTRRCWSDAADALRASFDARRQAARARQRRLGDRRDGRRRRLPRAGRGRAGRRST